MIRSSSASKPLLAALLVTLMQIAMAVGLLAPEGPLSYRYSTLVQHDSYWFMSIVDRGYRTIVPPIDHKVMEVSNVAFFPAYPAIASVLRYGLHIDTDNALLITAQIAAWGFWSYFFLFCDRKVWSKLMKRAMARKFSWDTSAQRYETLYKELVGASDQAAA